MKRIIKAVFRFGLLRRWLCFELPRTGSGIALTFDDGPSAEYTPVVLDILCKAGVRATFFLEGRWVNEYPELVKRIFRAGHVIGNHGVNHECRDVRMQAAGGAAALARIGIETELFRPAQGRLQAGGLLWLVRHGYRTVLWSFDTHDSMRAEGRWKGASPDYDCLRAGDIILMHDDNPVCVRELPLLIAKARGKGLRFRQLSG